MNYFTALLVSAGLPVLGLNATGPAPIPPTAPTPPLAAPAASGWPPAGVASEAAALATIRAVTTAAQAAPTSALPAPNAASGTVSPNPAPSAAPTTPADAAETLIAWTNQARAQAGLPPYTVNSTLMALAQARAQALAQGPFTSDLPGLGWPIQMETAAGIQAQAMGAENIAVAPTLAEAFQLLMASPPHRANLLSPYETQIGVGVAPDGNGWAISELFIGPNL
ncbi:MAG: CAP domain-containing protein [Firmicutes bacterium]|nr:CAP domain-containing protein [Alicyclobacillaceae bacterium]MCL6496452.1 CAP domain-containing protein [Bacillota bacterium]